MTTIYAPADVQLVEPSEADRYSRTLQLLGHPGRLRLAMAIQQNPMSTVTQLSEDVDLPLWQVSKLLRPLRMEGLVTHRVAGRFSYYVLTDEFVTNILDHVPSSTDPHDS